MRGHVSQVARMDPEQSTIRAEEKGLALVKKCQIAFFDRRALFGPMAYH